MNIFKSPTSIPPDNPQGADAGIEETFFIPPESTRAYVGVALSQRRLIVIRSVIIVILMIITARALQLQVLQFAAFRAAADRNRLRDDYLPAQRGVMSDRNGTPLVQNIASFSLLATPAELPSPGEASRALYQRLSNTVGSDISLLNVLDSKATRLRRQIALPIFLTHEQAIEFTLHQDDYPGISLQVVPTREYISSPYSLSHVLGYVGYPSVEDLEKNTALIPFALVGKSGLEHFYDSALRGQDGSVQWEYDSRGQRIRKVSSTQPIQGTNLQTTIDLPLQIATEQALQSQISATPARRGSAVVMNALTGEVLSLVSLPAYSSNVFTLPEQSSQRKKLLNDKNQPLFFRAISGQYPSGSVIKPFVAATALEFDIITERTSVMSTGGIQLGDYVFPDWKSGGHGVTNVVKALSQSVNTFFYLLVGGDVRSPSQWNRPALGVERFRQGLERFGWGSPVGIDLSGEASGFLPSPQWKKTVKGERWYIGDTYHIAIGQGDILVTPLQVSTATAIIANNGQTIKPWIVKQHSSNTVRKFSKESIDIVKRGMREAVLTGSARRLTDLPFAVWAKTGTAQLGGSKPTESWLTSFAVIHDTPIVVTVLVEEGGEGSGPALTVVKSIYQHLATHPTLYSKK